MDDLHIEYAKRLAAVFDIHGGAMPAYQYDEYAAPDKLTRYKLMKVFGTWEKAKQAALGYMAVEQIDGNPQFLVDQNNQLRRALEAEREKTRILVEACEVAATKIRLRPVAIPKKNGTRNDQQFHAIRSDTHVGELVDPVMVQGVSEYNFEIYKQRHQRWIEKVVQFKEEDSNLGLNRLVIHFLGDHVTGETIYRGQAFHIDLPLADQIFSSVEVEANGLLALAKVFPEIEVFCVWGNHGRLGKKGENHARSNADYIFYRTLAIALQGQENIKIYVSDSPAMLVQHGQFTFCLKHGDNVRGWMGIPHYGLTRDYQKLQTLYSFPVHYELVGHFHEGGELTNTVVLNGSFLGGTDYSVNRLTAAARPFQKIFYFDENEGMHRKTEIWLADPIETEVDEVGALTAWSGGVNLDT